MNNSNQGDYWYRTIAKTYSLKQRQNWYSEAAAAYDRHRPRYPQSICDRAVELTQLNSSSTILEIGCGPGIATLEFAKRGYSLVSLEPSEAACKLARRNCQKYPKVRIINATFEQWQPKTSKFDAVLAATSFHWLAPEIRYQKTAAVLKDQGFLVLLWNTPPQPDVEVCRAMESAYQRHAPSLKISEQIATYQENLHQIGEAVIKSGYFHQLISDYLICEVTYSVDSYIGMLSTLSPYIMLEAKQRNALFADLKQVLHENYGSNLALSYCSMFQVAQKL
ncbi:MAG: class I SAM-dependent methyltransferase [Pleurocapsa sp.]